MSKAEVDYIKHDERCVWELTKDEDFLLCNSLNAWSSPSTGLPRGARVAMRRAQERISSLYIKEGGYDKGHWIDNHNGTISCDHCHTWFYKNHRYSYMHYCPNCNIKMAESEA